MRANLQYGHRYRAVITVEPLFRRLVTDELISAELARWQLFGQVTEVGAGYQIDAKFQGASGTYDLPDAVTTFEFIE